MASDLVALYQSELCNLKTAEKTSINFLSMLAQDNVQEAIGITDAIELHLAQCSPQHKLPALYLMDSLIKNVGEPFKSLFSRNLPEVFCKVFASVQPPQRASLHKLRKTWTSVLPADVLANIDARLAPLEAALAPAAPAAYAPVPPAQPPAVTSVQQPAYSAAPYGAAAPAAVPGSAMPHMVQAPAAWQPGFLQPMPGNGTQYVMYGQGAMVQQTQPQFQQQQMQQLLPMQPVLNGFAPPQMQLPQQHQPQYQYMQPLPQQPTAAPQQQQPPQQQLPPPPALPSTGGQQATGGFDILASLLGILPSHLTADSGADASSSAGAVAPAAAPAAARVDDTFPSTSGRAEDIAGTEFDTKFIKDFHPGVLDALQRSSDLLRGRHLDAVYLRKKRQAAALQPCRRWYAPLDVWVAGTTAPSEADALEDQVEGEAAATPDVSVPVDETQPECAVSGERFEEVWHEATQTWHYQGAKRIHGDEAAQYGVPDGAIVKVKCLATAAAAPTAQNHLDAANLLADIMAAAAGAESAGAGEAGGEGGAEPGSTSVERKRKREEQEDAGGQLEAQLVDKKLHV